MHPAGEPARTITTTGHQSLVGWRGELPAVDDCTFRMLEPREIQAAMAFRRACRVLGTRREQVRQLGNAVTPPAAEFLIRAVVVCLASPAEPCAVGERLKRWGPCGAIVLDDLAG